MGSYDEQLSKSKYDAPQVHSDMLRKRELKMFQKTSHDWSQKELYYLVKSVVIYGEEQGLQRSKWIRLPYLEKRAMWMKIKHQMKT